MQNYDTFLELREEFANGEQFGSAERENARYVDSLKGKLNELKTVWTDIATTVINGNTLKKGVDVLINVSNVISDILKTTEELGATIPTVITAISSIGTIGKFSFGKMIENEETGKKEFEELPKLQEMIEKFREGMAAAKDEGTDELRGGLENLFEGMDKAELKARAMSVGIGLLQDALVGLAVFGITKAVQKIIEFKNRIKDAHDELKATVETTQSENNSLRDNIKTISGMCDEYDELAGKTKLTSDEHERLIALRKEIADIFPDLVSGYDEFGNPILALTGTLKDYKEQLEDTLKEQERLLDAQENALGNAGTKRANEIKKGNRVNPSSIQDRINNIKYSFTDVGGNYKSLKESLETYTNYLDKRNEIYENYNKRLAEENEELFQIETEVQTEVMNKLQDGFSYTNFNELNERAQASMSQLVGNFNWVSDLTLDTAGKNRFIRAFDDISKTMKGRSAEVNNWNETLREAEYIYQNTGNIEAYREQIGYVAEELAEITNISKEDWIIGLTPELKGTLDGEKAAFQEYLSNYGLTLQDWADENPVALDLKIQWDRDNQILMDLATFEGDKEEMITYLVGLRESEGFNQLSPQTQAILSGTLDDGKNVSEKELTIALSIISKMSTLGQLTGKNATLMEKILNGTATEEDLKADITINGEMVLSAEMARYINNKNKGQKEKWNVEVEPNVINKEEYAELIEKQLGKFANLGNEERKLVRDLFIQGKIVGIENMELVETIIEMLDVGKQNTDELIAENYEAISQLKTYEAFSKWLNSQDYDFKKRYGFENGIKESTKNVQNLKKEIKEAAEEAEALTDGDTTVTVNSGELQGTVEDYKELIKYSTKLENGKYKISFVTDTTDAIENLNNLVKVVDEISASFEKIPDIEIKIETALASQNLTGLSANIDNYISKYADTKIQTRFGTETALASKNVTGLKNNVESYVNKYVDKTFLTRFKTETALASKNVTGLKNNIADYVEKYAGKTFTTTFKTLLETTKSGGNGSGGQGPSSIQTPARDISSNPFQTEIGIAPTSVNMDSNNVSSMVNSAMPSTISTKAKLDVGVISGITTLPTKINASVKNLLDAVKYGIELFQELQNRIEKVNNNLSLLDTKMERAVGTKKIEYLEKQNALYKEQQKLQKELYDGLYKEKEALREELKKQGFTFDEQENLTNYEEKLLEMERKAEQLQKAADKASNNSNSKASKTLEDYKEKLDNVKKLTDGYLSLHNKELSDISNEWESINNKIEENNDEIEKLVRENKLYTYKNTIVEVNNELDILSDKYDLLDIKMQHATGEEQFSMYNQQIKLIEKQQQAQEELIKSYTGMIDIYKTDLSKYGFKFDEENNLTNQKEILDNFQNHEDLKKVTELMEEYIDIQTGELPDAISEWHDLGNAIKDIYNEKLDLTKEIEDKITEIYRDEIEKRKDDIQKQADKEVDAINKVKEAYEKTKEENDFEKERLEQEEKIAQINRDIERYRRDNSLSSQAKLSELLDELKEEQENLDKLIEDRKNELVSDMFDDQIDKIQQESEKAQEKLDEEWTDSKISEMVQQALETSVFTDLDGNIIDLQSKMLEFAETSGEALGILGDKVKNELVGNLQAAIEILKEYPTIMKELDLKEYESATLDSSKLSQNISNKNVNVGDINISVTGNDNAVNIAKEVKKQVNECLTDIINRV